VASKGDIISLRVCRKETIVSSAGLEMDRMDLSETKESKGQPQVQWSVSVGHKASRTLFRRLLKHFNPDGRDGDRFNHTVTVVKTGRCRLPPHGAI
jgi:hypothetical protein